jgi:hypothetical protein
MPCLTPDSQQPTPHTSSLAPDTSCLMVGHQVQVPGVRYEKVVGNLVSNTSFQGPRWREKENGNRAR